MSTPQPASAEAFHLVAWAIIQDAESRVLLARRAEVAYGVGLWGLPGGHVDDHETLAEAAARETREEVGIAVVNLRPVGMSRYVDGPTRGLDTFFEVTAWTGVPAPVAECDEVGFFALDQLPDDVLPWLPGSLRHHLDAGAWFAETIQP